MEQLFGAIPDVLRGLGNNDGVEEAVVFAAWRRCAGDLLRTRTAPVEFFDNRLVVAVADETWRRHLEDLSPQMLYKLNACLGEGTVTFIEFRIGPKAIKALRNESKSPSKKTVAEVWPSLRAAAEAIADEGLRKQFLGAAAEYLAKQRRKN
ncbi:MAG: DUF721 domain-containing protein [Pyrinomonadaceae bacterium]